MNIPIKMQRSNKHDPIICYFQKIYLKYKNIARMKQKEEKINHRNIDEKKDRVIILIKVLSNR